MASSASNPNRPGLHDLIRPFILATPLGAIPYGGVTSREWEDGRV